MPRRPNSGLLLTNTAIGLPVFPGTPKFPFGQSRATQDALMAMVGQTVGYSHPTPLSPAYPYEGQREAG